MTSQQFVVGERIDGVVNNVTPIGIFVTLPGHHSGLVHHSDFENYDLAQIKTNYQIGQAVRVVITEIKHERIALSLSRVDSIKLSDPTNPFEKLTADDFYRRLDRVVSDAKVILTKLKKYSENGR